MADTAATEAGLCVMVWGAPACGKSALCRRVTWLYQERTGRALPHLSSDGISHAVVGPDYVAAIRPAVYAGLRTLASELVAAGFDVLLDANYVRADRRQAVRESCSRILSVLVESPLDYRLERNAARGPGERVPEEWIREAHALAEAGRAEADLILNTAELQTEAAAQRIIDRMRAG